MWAKQEASLAADAMTFADCRGLGQEIQGKALSKRRNGGWKPPLLLGAGHSNSLLLATDPIDKGPSPPLSESRLLERCQVAVQSFSNGRVGACERASPSSLILRAASSGVPAWLFQAGISIKKCGIIPGFYGISRSFASIWRPTEICGFEGR
jgi:hypothetical protein